MGILAMLRKRTGTRGLSKEIQQTGKPDAIRERAERTRALAAAEAAQTAEEYRFPRNRIREFESLRTARLKTAGHISRIFKAQYSTDLQQLLSQKIVEVQRHLSLLTAFINDDCHAQDLAEGHPSKSRVDRAFLYIFLEIDAWTSVENQLTQIQQKVQFEITKGHLDPGASQLQSLITLVTKRIQTILHLLQAEYTFTQTTHKGIIIELSGFMSELRQEKSNAA